MMLKIIFQPLQGETTGICAKLSQLSLYLDIKGQKSALLSSGIETSSFLAQGQFGGAKLWMVQREMLFQRGLFGSCFSIRPFFSSVVYH